MNKRDDKLNSALKLFVEQGEQATSMKWLAKEANCGIEILYNYFASKDELINALYVEFKTKLSEYVFKTKGTDIPINNNSLMLGQ